MLTDSEISEHIRNTRAELEWYRTALVLIADGHSRPAELAQQTIEYSEYYRPKERP